MNAPKRVQLRRTRGWRLPEGTVVVARPSKWGNPFRLHSRTSRLSVVQNYALAVRRGWGPEGPMPTFDEIRAELAGRDLACWCRLDQPCHADVLIQLANGGAP